MRDNDIDSPILVPWHRVLHPFSVFSALIIIIVSVIAWQSRWPRYEISAQKIREPFVRDVHCQEYAYALQIHVTGEINGHARFVTPIGSFELQPGQVNLETGSDYYEERARLEYIPADVTEGHLIVKYKLKTH